MRCSRSSRFSCNVRACASSPLWEEAASSASLSPQPSLLCSRLNATACSACWRFDLRAVTMASLVSALARQWCAARLSLFTCSASSRFCIFIVSISKSFSWKRREIPCSIAATNSLECRCLFSSRSCRTCSPWMCWEQIYQQQPGTKFKWKNSMETLHHLFRSHPASLSLSWLKTNCEIKDAAFTWALKSSSISSLSWWICVLRSPPMMDKRGEEPFPPLPLAEAEDVEFSLSSSNASRNPVETLVDGGITTDPPVTWFW